MNGDACYSPLFQYLELTKTFFGAINEKYWNKYSIKISVLKLVAALQSFHCAFSSLKLGWGDHAQYYLSKLQLLFKLQKFWLDKYDLAQTLLKKLDNKLVV